jgi:hypothetical protein
VRIPTIVHSVAMTFKPNFPQHPAQARATQKPLSQPVVNSVQRENVESLTRISGIGEVPVPVRICDAPLERVAGKNEHAPIMLTENVTLAQRSD